MGWCLRTMRVLGYNQRMCLLLAQCQRKEGSDGVLHNSDRAVPLNLPGQRYSRHTCCITFDDSRYSAKNDHYQIQFQIGEMSCCVKFLHMIYISIDNEQLMNIICTCTADTVYIGLVVHVVVHIY